MIYLDNAATTNKKPYQVKDAVLRELESSANPGRASHQAGINALNRIYETREALSDLFNVGNPENFILTPNATYALNFAIKGFLKPYDHIITTSMEHNSVIRPLYALNGIDITVIKGDNKGYIDPAKIENAIRRNTRLIIINHSSNVNGIIQSIDTIADIASKRNIAVLIDASQSAGVINADWKRFDMIALPGHKSLYGPQGTGALYVRPGINLSTLVEGGTGSNSKSRFNPSEYPDRLESGTLNTPGFAGLSAGIRFVLSEGIRTIYEYEHYLLSSLVSSLSNMDSIKLYSPVDLSRISNSVAFNINGMDSTTVADILNTKYNIAVRPGYHCAYPAHETLGSEESGAVRVSVSYFNKIREIRYFIDSVNRIVHS